MNLFFYLVIGLCAGYLAAYFQVQQGWMLAVYLAVGVVAAMVAGGLLSLALNLIKTLILLATAAALVVMVAKVLPT